MLDPENELWPEELNRLPRPLTEADKKDKVMLLVVNWIKDSLPQYSAYLSDAMVFVRFDVEKQRYYARIGVKQSSGYDYFSFWVDVMTNTVEPIEPHR